MNQQDLLSKIGDQVRNLVCFEISNLLIIHESIITQIHTLPEGYRIERSLLERKNEYDFELLKSVRYTKEDCFSPCPKKRIFSVLDERFNEKGGPA
jgi:hypothetical protein